MPHSPVGRREFLKRAGVVGVAAASEHALAPANSAEAQIAAPNPSSQKPVEASGYTYLKPGEAAFVEALVDHMIPKDELTGSLEVVGNSVDSGDVRFAGGHRTAILALRSRGGPKRGRQDRCRCLGSG